MYRDLPAASIWARDLAFALAAARLGHSTITLTLDTYTHVVPGMQELAYARLETLLATPAAAAQG
jgi:integrase